MQKKLGGAVNRLLKPAGLRVQRVGAEGVSQSQFDFLWQKYRATVQELYGCITERVLVDLPPVEGRLDLLARLIGTDVSEGLWVLDALHRALPLDGDVCEFGVAQGATSALLANEIRATDKALWLFDSFQGLPRPHEKDRLINDIFNLGSMEAYRGQMNFSDDLVRERLAGVGFPSERAHIVAGFIEDTIHTSPLPERVCFAYIDFDFYMPILTALNFLAARLPVGGRVVVDDYGYFSSGVQTAVEEFMAAHSDAYALELPPDWAGHFATLIRQQ